MSATFNLIDDGVKVNRLSFTKDGFAYNGWFSKASTPVSDTVAQAIGRCIRWVPSVIIFVFVAFSITVSSLAHSSAEKIQEPPVGLEVLTKPRLVGHHLFTFFGLEIYHISLWSSPEWMPEKWNQHPFALSLVYSRNLSGEDIAKRSIVEIKKQRVISSDMAQQWLSQLSALIPSVKPGDRLTGVYQPSGDLVFWMGSKKLGTIKDAALSEAFMGIWISTKTSEPKMREKLLGMLLE
jgi:hypothetical protein